MQFAHDTRRQEAADDAWHKQIAADALGKQELADMKDSAIGLMGAGDTKVMKSSNFGDSITDALGVTSGKSKTSFGSYLDPRRVPDKLTDALGVTNASFNIESLGGYLADKISSIWSDDPKPVKLTPAEEQRLKDAGMPPEDIQRVKDGVSPKVSPK